MPLLGGVQGLRQAAQLQHGGECHSKDLDNLGWHVLVCAQPPINPSTHAHTHSPDKLGGLPPKQVVHDARAVLKVAQPWEQSTDGGLHLTRTRGDWIETQWPCAGGPNGGLQTLYQPTSWQKGEEGMAREACWRGLHCPLTSTLSPHQAFTSAHRFAPAAQKQYPSPASHTHAPVCGLGAASAPPRRLALQGW